MALSAAPGEDDIIAQLKTIEGVDVFSGDFLPDGYKPKLDSNSMFKPYLLVKFSGSFFEWDRGIVGPDKDTLRNTFSVYVVSPDDRTSRMLRDQVRVKMLTDFRPTDAGPLRPAGSFNFVDTDLGYNRYVHNIGFGYLFNLS